MLELGVPGLGEKRPSVINNDMIDIKLHDDDKKCYRGIVKKVNDKTVEIAYLHNEYVLKELCMSNMHVTCYFRQTFFLNFIFYFFIV